MHKQLNNPPSIMKQIPSMISKQVSDISFDKDHFNKAEPDYNTALKKNCLFECLVYNAFLNTTTTKNCFGACKKIFKEKYNNHTSSFKNKSRQKISELSNYIWELKKMIRITHSIAKVPWKRIHRLVERENVIYVCMKN